MSKLLPFGLGALMFMGAAAHGYGQVNTTDGGYVPGHGRVNAVDKQQRVEKQDIAAGETSGKITEAEGADLKRKENQIQSEKIHDMATHHGHLTKGEAKQLKKEEKKLDKEIKGDLGNPAAKP